MSQIVSISSHHSVGGTFLDWSVLYLSGLQQHYHSAQNKWLPIPDDPQSSANGVYNAHRHCKNHPSGLTQTLEMLCDLRGKTESVETIYPFPLYLDLCCDALHLDANQLGTSSDCRLRVLDFWINDYTLLLEACLDQGSNLIYIHADPAPMGYYWNTRTVHRGLFSTSKVNSPDEVRSERDNFYFSNSQKDWQDMGLTEVWDVRERMALDYRPFDSTWFPKIGLTRRYLHIDCRDLWNLLPQTVERCFEYLEQPIYKPRWESWLMVAQRWQEHQRKLLCFFHSLDHIIDATLNGWYYPLPKLELWQEALIQHVLIYKHGCNLKTWQLDQFPDNTQKLNVLLEPNIHKVPKIY